MSSHFDRKKIIPRFKIISFTLVLLGVIVIAKATYIAVAQRPYWTAVAARLQKDSVDVKPVRGNILSDDGSLLASSLPEYMLLMDFNAVKQAGKDSLLLAKMDSICDGLHQIFPERTAEEFKSHLMEGREKEHKNWKIWNRRVSHNIYAEVKKLPVFNLISYKGGFHTETFDARQHPHGSLAIRTIGSLYGVKDSAKCGLELSFDSILRGEMGKVNRQKVMNKYLSITVKEPIDGADIVTTLDMGIQDLAERALVSELKDIEAETGVAIVMEVATGDIKAIVNMDRLADGNYVEIKNHAVNDLLEPGSVFKTASMLVALDDGVCDTSEIVHTGSGVMDMYGAKMRDHNWTRGGYGTINMVQAMQKSSNIGVSKIIDKYYHSRPEKFVEGIYRLGLNTDFQLPIMGYTPAKIRMPNKVKKQYTNWSNTALPWMSIGYETQVPPITTITFYNAIANGGKMMRPRLVKQVIKNGEVLKEFQPEVIKEHIAKPEVISKMQKILTSVVSVGTGKKAGSKSFAVAGKTGTAQISKGKAGYKSGAMKYLISFCGFFPADNPKYTCIVCIQKFGAASGGTMCGKVFHEISEGIMAQNIKRAAEDARNENSTWTPDVKNGNLGAAGIVLNKLGIPTDCNFSGTFNQTDYVWGTTERKEKSVALRMKTNMATDTMPDVHGMGARDAVYLLENCGLKVKLNGRGKVKKQSIAAGSTIKKGAVCEILLDS